MEEKKILIVEDNLEVSIVIKNQLTSIGYKINHIVDSGKKAIEECEKNPPDIVLMDITLKEELSGIEASKEILKRFDIPIVFLTGNVTEDFITEATNAGAYGYLLKPVKKQDLQVALEIALHKHNIDKNTKLSETLYKAVVEDQTELITRYSLDFKLTFVNNSFCKYYNTSKESAIGNSIDMYIYDQDKKSVLDEIQKISVENQQITIEHRTINSAGEIRWIQRIDRAIFFDNKLFEYQSVSRDITDTKKDEYLLKIQRDLSLKLIDNSLSFEEKLDECLSYALILANMEKGIVYLFSEEKRDFYLAKSKGLTPDEIEKALYVERDSTYYKYLMLKKAIYATEKKLKLIKNSIAIPYVKTVINLPLVFNNKHIACIVLLSTRNKTVSKSIKNILETLSIQMAQLIAYAKAEDQLKDEKELLSTTLRSISDGVISTNIKGEIILFNPIAEEITEWQKEDVIGKNINLIFKIKEEEELSIDNIFESIIKQKKIDYYSYNSELLTKNKNIKNIEFTVSALRDKNKNITGVAIVFKDITKKLKLEEEIMKANKLESLGSLAGGIAHDFNNYMTSILGNISLALALTEDNNISKFLTEAENAIIKSKNLAQQLLTFAKGGSPITEPACIKKTIQQALTYITKSSNISFNLELIEDLMPVEIDIEQIGLVFKNIFLNAIQAMPDGGVIKIKANTILINENSNLPIKKGQYIKISITDQGIGIPDNFKDKVFDPYFTLNKNRPGLGLAICYSIIKRHNGLITFESEENKGSTFYIYLPVSTKKIEKTVQNNNIKFGKGKLLIMEDEEVVSNVLASMLSYLGYDYTITKEGSETIEKYKEAKKSGNPFHLILMDLTIKDGMDGETAIKEILKVDPEAKVIATSGYSNSPILSEHRKYGFIDSLVKPYRIETLSEIINKALEKL